MAFNVSQFKAKMRSWLFVRGGMGKFVTASEAHNAFVTKLDMMWRTRNIHPDSAQGDVDALVTLTEDEADKLWQKFEQLLAKM